jgi:hypothetical protein
VHERLGDGVELQQRRQGLLPRAGEEDRAGLLRDDR